VAIEYAVKFDKAQVNFESVREHLFMQFKNPPFDPHTGLSLPELEREVEEYLRSHSKQQKILQKANVFRIVLTRGQIDIDPVDWFVDKLNDGCLLYDMTPEVQRNSGGLVRKLAMRWLDEAMAGPIAQTTTWINRAVDMGYASIPEGGLDRGHISPGWTNLLSNGLIDLMKAAKTYQEALGDNATPKQLAFYEAVDVVGQAVIDYAQRFADLARRMIFSNPEHEERLQAIASACSNVPAHRPRNFHEALQFMWFMNELIEREGEFVRSMGGFDRLLYPFYKADIESGRLTRTQAKELIKFFWFKFFARTEGASNGKNFCFGGQYSDGSLIDNDLTYLGLEAYEELNTPDPKLSVRFLPVTPDKLYYRVADLIRKGHNAFVLLNDTTSVAAQLKRGKTLEDARMYVPIGCYEPTTEGKEIACNMNNTVNLAKGVELALSDGVDPLTGVQFGPKTGDLRTATDFEQIWNAYVRQMDYFLETARSSIEAAEKHWSQINPSPLLSTTFKHCLQRGKDISQGGSLYNAVGFVGAGLANAADSLLAIKKSVFDEKRYTMTELLEALACDFEGHEKMRQYLLNRIPKWGNNDSEADTMAKRVADYYCNKIHTMTNGRGGPCQAALFSLTFALHGGERTGALPDGRKACMSLSPNMGASYGCDSHGVTALMGSAEKIDAMNVPNGAVIDVTLHPTAVAGDDGLDAFVTLIKAHFQRGGSSLQFNVYDIETLKDAQQHPEKYRTLQIRLTGWSVYFNTLSRKEQNAFMSRVIHGI
jgi:pyruvate-formate lyase